jgi:CheY-like chemotaxis protein
VPPTLLLADDSLTIRKVIELTFADEGIRVVTVADGREAIRRITAEPPDIILADVGMPEHDGYEVTAFVKKSAHLAHIPVLLLAGAFEPVDQARARNVGCDGVLVKPFEPQLVIARVRELLAGRRPATQGSSAPGQAEAAPEAERSDSTGSTGGEGDYLDRLDAAFAAMSASPRPMESPSSTPVSPGEESGDVGWNPEIVTNSGQPVHREVAMPPAAPPSAGSGSVYQAPASPAAQTSPSLSEAFSSLLAAERGTASGAGPVLPPVALSDATLDEIARRVIARLGDEPMRQAVLDAAERLVREEIDRIKKGQHQPGGGA